MCGKFVQSRKEFPAILTAMTPGLEEKVKPPNDQPAVNYNVRPMTKALVVRQSKNGPEPADLSWGLIPYFVKDLSAFRASTINARSEEVHE
jgi:putative SOS response-associated peptidase YedK